MKTRRLINPVYIILPLFIVMSQSGRAQQNTDPLWTPLPQETLDILANEISGQFIFNNLVTVAGAPWLRTEEEFNGTFYETDQMYRLVRSYGIDNVKIERYSSDRKFSYPSEGELWITSPEKKLVARLGADAALVAGGSQTGEVSGRLIYISPSDEEEIIAILDDTDGGTGLDKYRGKIALMWSHPRGELARALDFAGLQAVISFNSRERYVDPAMVVYSSGSYAESENLRMGFTVSWKQWSEMLEDVEYNTNMEVHGKVKMESKQDRFEAVFSWIPGTEPDKKGVIFTAHLFEGYTKRGANDNAGGCVVQLEILRALSRLIETGQIEKPRRNIYFLWPNEISGTYEFIKNNPDIIKGSAININMDMVTEALRLNNSVLTFSETPAYLPSFYDGLAERLMNYVWRTNDIVYLGNSPRGRRNGQYFPDPMTEKNGSVDAFRFFMHSATGGSDHLCFNNPSTGVPGIEFFTWPDYRYHADTDVPAGGDPTQMKRIAFIGAATAYATVNCTDAVLHGLLDAVSNYGYARIGERELPDAMAMINNSTKENISDNYNKALQLINLAADREIGSLKSLSEISTGTAISGNSIKARVDEWKFYRESLGKHLQSTASIHAGVLKVKKPEGMPQNSLEKKYDKIIPSLHPDVKYNVFSLTSFPAYMKYAEDNRGTKAVEVASARSSRNLLNYINGKRSVADINLAASAETGSEFKLEETAEFFEMLKEIGFVVY